MVIGFNVCCSDKDLIIKIAGGASACCSPIIVLSSKYNLIGNE